MLPLCTSTAKLSWLLCLNLNPEVILGHNNTIKTSINPTSYGEDRYLTSHLTVIQRIYFNLRGNKCSSLEHSCVSSSGSELSGCGTSLFHFHLAGSSFHQQHMQQSERFSFTRYYFSLLRAIWRRTLPKHLKMLH